jgi:hypothetical protein
MPGTAQDAVLDEFVEFLRAERGLAEQTICCIGVRPSCSYRRSSAAR